MANAETPRRMNLQIKIPAEKVVELERLAASKGLTPTTYGKMLIYEAIERAQAA